MKRKTRQATERTETHALLFFYFFLALKTVPTVSRRSRNHSLVSGPWSAEAAGDQESSACRAGHWTWPRGVQALRHAFYCQDDTDDPGNKILRPLGASGSKSGVLGLAMARLCWSERRETARDSGAIVDFSDVIR